MRYGVDIVLPLGDGLIAAEIEENVVGERVLRLTGSRPDRILKALDNMTESIERESSELSSILERVET